MRGKGSGNRLILLTLVASLLVPFVAGCSSSPGHKQTVEANKVQKQEKANK